MRREDHTNDFISYVMTPPLRSRPEYENYVPEVSSMQIVSDGKSRCRNGCNGDSGLGQLPSTMPISGSWMNNEWVMPVVLIVVSAMALMTLYSILNKR